MKKEKINFTEFLRGAGYKATPARIILMEVLEKEKHPVNIAFLRKGLKGKIDQATIYRTLNSLVESNFVNKTQIDNSSAYFELAFGRKHHHHIVCTNCQKIEDFTMSDEEVVEKRAIQNSKVFSKITNHIFELYGLCDSCIEKV